MPSAPAGHSSSADESSDTGVVSWVALPDHQSDPYFLAVRHLLAGVVGVFLLVVGGFGAFLLARSALGPSTDALLVVVVLALVGGPFSLIYVLIAADAGSERERALFSPDLSWLRLRWLLPGLVAGAGLLAGLGAVFGPIVVLFLPFGLAFLVSSVDSRYTVGRIDPEERTVEFYTGKLAREYAESHPAVADEMAVPTFDTADRNRRAGDLSSLAGTDSYRIGSYVVVRLRYHDRDLLGNRPTLLVVPAEASSSVESVLARITTSTDWEPSGGLDRDVRLVLGVLGVLFFGSVGLFALVTDGEPVILFYAGTTLGLLGAVMVAAALFG
ncbi:hypothetical protein [Salinirubrum litoreum]|uniref:PH domain-containing protein n=1 Tax=Salinirubrum litoreum TaxID=1126234 RepID=A0ABD5R8W4_9EURY|nr:hypothetical protein [Salinirubrum litoreum]